MDQETSRPRRRAVVAVAALLLSGLGASGCTASSEEPQGERGPSPKPSVTQKEKTPNAPSSASPSADQDGLPAFSATVRRIGPDLRDRMRFSYRPGCPVSPRDLRYVRMSFVRFDRSADTGEMVVHKTYATSVVEVFQRLYESRWPIRRMRLVDDYRGDDDASLAANNTSGFNCRSVSGGEGWSEHAYGRAIDINPVQNPYVYDSVVSPPSGRRFTDIDRSGAGQVPRGVIRSGDVVVSAFRRIGWEWGGDWTSAKDYQHFSATGH